MPMVRHAVQDSLFLIFDVDDYYLQYPVRTLVLGKGLANRTPRVSVNATQIVPCPIAQNVLELPPPLLLLLFQHYSPSSPSYHLNS